MKLYNSAEASDVGVMVQDAYILYTHPETVNIQHSDEPSIVAPLIYDPPPSR